MDVQRSPFPHVERPLSLNPSLALLRQFHVEIVDDVRENQAHLGVCKAGSRVSQSASGASGGG